VGPPKIGLTTDNWQLVLRRDLKDGTNAVGAGPARRGVDISACVENHAAIPKVSDAAGEAGLRPLAVRRGQSEDLQVGCKQRSVEIAGGVHGQLGEGAYVEGVKLVERPAAAGGCQLVHYGLVLRRAICDAIEIANLVEDQAPIRVGIKGEGVDDTLGPAAF